MAGGDTVDIAFKIKQRIDNMGQPQVVNSCRKLQIPLGDGVSELKKALHKKMLSLALVDAQKAKISEKQVRLEAETFMQ